MAVQISPDSETGKRLREWDTPRTRLVDENALPGDPWHERYGRRAPGYEEYPRMLYKAQPTRTGKVECMLPPPDPMGYETQPEYDRAVRDVEQFNKRCQLVVNDESQFRRAFTDGWRTSIADALSQYEQQQREIGDEAARRAFRDQRLSAKAQAEIEAAEAETHEHLPSMPVKKRGPYRRKVTPKAGTPATE